MRDLFFLLMILNNYEAKSDKIMARYEDIQSWVKEKYGFSVKTCWIAHMKEKHGLSPRKSWNRKNSDFRLNPCPEKVEEAITEAMYHFKMI
ncbi:hypothetical protein DSECCO2_52010 [anaerobic digester metagenome]